MKRPYVSKPAAVVTARYPFDARNLFLVADRMVVTVVMVAVFILSAGKD